MRKELVICDEKYTPVELTFGNLAQFEDLGVDPLDISGKPFKAIGAYVALTVGCSLDEAFKLIETHIKKGGNTDEISGALAEAIEESGFFQSLLGTKPAQENE